MSASWTGLETWTTAAANQKLLIAAAGMMDPQALIFLTILFSFILRDSRTFH